MKAKHILMFMFIILNISLNAQNDETLTTYYDSTLFYVNFYVDDVEQNKSYEIYFLDSANQIIRPQIYCDTCTPKLFIKPNYYICDSCFNHLTFVYYNNEYEVIIEKLYMNYHYTNIEVGIITQPHKLVKCLTLEELKIKKKEIKKEKEIPSKYKINAYYPYYYLYHSPKNRYNLYLYNITRKTKIIQYARVGRYDSMGPSTYYNYMGNKQISRIRLWRYWGHRLKWYFP